MAVDAGTIYSAIRIKLANLQSDISVVKSRLAGMTANAKKQSTGFAGFWKNAFSTAFGFGAIQLITKLVGAIKNAIGVFTGFQQSMKNVQSVTGAVGEDFRRMEEAAKKMGETTRFTARQSADALYFLGSAGFSAQQSIDALSGVLQLAGATQSDLASTAETVAAIISQYSLEAEEAGRVSNAFAAAIGNSQATMEKLSASFRHVGPVAAGFGMTVEQTTGALQELYNAGFRGQQAGRALKSALADLAAPTSNMRKIFNKLGIELKEVNPETNSLVEIIDVLAKSGATTSNIISAFGKIAGPQMAVLIKQGSQSLQEYTDAVTDTQAAAEAYEIQNDSLAGSLDFLKSKLESTAISIFEKMEPGMRDLIDSFINFLEAAKPIGEILGTILNVILKIASFSTTILTNIFGVLLNIFKGMPEPMRETAEAFDNVRESIEEVGEIQNTINNLNRLISEYERLTSKTNLTKDEQDNLRDVITQIEKIVPDAVIRFDEYGNAIEISGKKSKEAATRMLEARRAIILEAKTRLESQKPILENIIERDKREVKAAKKKRNRQLKDAEYSAQILSESRRFWTLYRKYEKENLFTAYEKTVKELKDTLIITSQELVNTEGNVVNLAEGILRITNETLLAEESLGKLEKANKKVSDIELEYKDAEKLLKELADLEKELDDVQYALKSLDETEVDVPDVPTETQKTWKDFISEINKATEESRLFGDKQDVLKAKIDFLKKAYLELMEKGLDPTGKLLTKIRKEYDDTVDALDDTIQKEKEDLEFKEKIKKWYDDIIDSSEEAKKSWKETAVVILSISQQLADALIGLFSEITQGRIDELDRQMQAELEAAGLTEETEKEQLEKKLEEAEKAGDTETAQKAQDDLDRLAIEDKYEKKKADIQYKAAMFEWQLTLLSAGALLAEAILKATAAAAWPMNLPAIGFALAQGINVAKVLASQPVKPSFESGGLFLGPGRGDPAGTSAMLHPPEMILNTDQMSNLFDAINTGNIGNGNQAVNVTVVYQVDGINIARITERAANNGQITFIPDRALRK